MKKRASTVFTPERRLLLEIVDDLVEGIILLDPDRRIAWANDTALKMHGATTLADLGETAAGYRKRYALRYLNQRKLQARQYPMDRVLAGEAFKDLVVEVCRRHDPEHRHIQQVRGLLVTDAQAQPQGMVLILLDITQRHAAEQRFERTFNANPAPALICSLADMQYVKVNQGFLQMTGYERQDVLGHDFGDVDALGDAGRDADLRTRLAEGRTIPQTETLISLPDGSQKLVLAAGQPIEIGDDPHPCMLFTYNDLESRRQVEHALRHSEERFSTVFRLAPAPMLLSTREGKVLEVNEAFETATGYSAADLARHDDALGLLGFSGPAPGPAVKAFRQGGSLRAYEMPLRTSDGSLLDCLLSVEPVTIGGQRCMLSVLQDITERKRSETELMAAIEAVMKDASWFSQTVIEKLAQIRQPRVAPSAHAELGDLTAREHEVLGLMCRGLGDADIAQELGLSRHTIRNHVASLYSKLGVHRRSAAIIWAQQRGIVGRANRPRRRTAPG
ncbi:PAS domain S-box protein [Bordetella genomosp. 7]|uniref:Helix-turn-helix transcriptional regulator n=1 Tax=Bordetella genomosp. 7 TaxID=1416805 RepID=A0A261RJE2_9BORD|nr:PAS domain S-box protein [Bordetella genomosp. 7]OZI25139.1 helix-turn-helix transcriptional regulator [Bordetella genomosp. 7]